MNTTEQHSVERQVKFKARAATFKNQLLRVQGTREQGNLFM